MKVSKQAIPTCFSLSITIFVSRAPMTAYASCLTVVLEAVPNSVGTFLPTYITSKLICLRI